MRRYKFARLSVGSAVCAGLFFFSPAEAQVPAPASLPDAPSFTSPHGPATLSFELQSFGGAPQQDTTAQAIPSHEPVGGVTGLIKRGVQDQKEIYTAPFHRNNLKWDALFLVATGGLIAADRHASGAISGNDPSISKNISDIGLYSTVATTAVLYFSGLLKQDEHAREAGFLGFEALGNTLVVDAATQVLSGRERPLEGAGHGRFWVNNAIDSSFPSQHSGLTWSMAAVLAHEYPQPWVKFLAYGTATTVSVARVTGQQHFPADVVVGGVFGYLIGQHILRAHSRFSGSHHSLKSDRFKVYPPDWESAPWRARARNDGERGATGCWNVAGGPALANAEQKYH